MDFNIFLARFGLSPDNFVNKYSEPIQYENGFIYELEEKNNHPKCVLCEGKTKVYKRPMIEVKNQFNAYTNDIIRIKRVRHKCMICGKTFYEPLKGITPHSKITQQTLMMILNDFKRMKSFSEIAKDFGLTPMRIIEIFDQYIPFQKRNKLSEILCIDEIYFSYKPTRTKYPCVLYDYKNKTIIDMVVTRQKSVLEEYFNQIPTKELQNVRFFVSDMYAEYRSLKEKFLPKAIHIVDIFHVIRTLTTAINTLRVRVMNKVALDGTPEKNFMKAHYSQFLCRREKIKDKYYLFKKTGEIYHYDELVSKCVKLHPALLNGYDALQDLYHYSNFFTFTEAYNFFTFISNRLLMSENELLISVGNTYKKWIVEISNAFSKSYKGSRITNSVAENTNNKIKTLVKIGYGYRNFPRFRNRIMYIINN